MQASQKYLDRFTHIEDKLRRTYAAMVSAVDDGVGRVIDKLDEHDLAENTLVFFLSDNGGATNNGSINAPLRGKKKRDGLRWWFTGAVRISVDR
jgi:arylsulfatase A-like enzyme